MLIEGPVHVAAGVAGHQHCRRCSTELNGRSYNVGQLVVERTEDSDDGSVSVRWDAVSRNGSGTIYLCDEEPPAAFI